MTLNEAINSGEKFKRPRHKGFILVNEQGILEWDHTDAPLTISVKALHATDWRLESEYVTISKAAISKDFKEFFREIPAEKIDQFLAEYCYE